MDSYRAPAGTIARFMFGGSENPHAQSSTTHFGVVLGRCPFHLAGNWRHAPPSPQRHPGTSSGTWEGAAWHVGLAAALEGLPGGMKFRSPTRNPRSLLQNCEVGWLSGSRTLTWQIPPETTTGSPCCTCPCRGRARRARAAQENGSEVPSHPEI